MVIEMTFLTWLVVGIAVIFAFISVCIMSEVREMGRTLRVIKEALRDKTFDPPEHVNCRSVTVPVECAARTKMRAPYTSMALRRERERVKRATLEWVASKYLFTIADARKVKRALCKRHPDYKDKILLHRFGLYAYPKVEK